MVLARRPGRAWRLGMLCGRAGGQERCAFDAIVDNEDLHLVSSFDSICSRVKTPRVKKAGGSDGKGTRSDGRVALGEFCRFGEFCCSHFTGTDAMLFMLYSRTVGFSGLH